MLVRTRAPKAVIGGLLSGVLLMLAAPATAAPTTPGVTFGLGPASAAGRVDGRAYFNYVATRGAQITDHVAVVNLSDKPQTFSLYVTDAANGEDGSFSYPLPSQKPTDAGSWMHVITSSGTSQVTVPPRQTIGFPITVSVPADAAPGDHAAAVLVSLKAAGNQGSQRVTLDQRVAARAFFRISGPVHAKLDVQRLTAKFEPTGIFGGTVTTTYLVRNVGNVKLAGRQLVRVSGLLTSREEHPTDVPVLLPNGSVLVTTVTKGVHPFIWMTSKVSVTPLGIQGDAAAPSSVATSQVHFWAVPWVLVLAALLIVLLGSVGRRLRRRRATGPQAGPQLVAPTAALTPAPAAAPRAPAPVVVPEPDPIPEDWSTPYASGFTPVVESTDR